MSTWRGYAIAGRWGALVAIMLAVGLSACTNYAGRAFDSFETPTQAGATVGGAQDIRYARNQVRAGAIPIPEAITAEGLFSEHDLPAHPHRCRERFCLHGEVGLMRHPISRQPRAFVQVALQSGIDLSRFERGPLNLALVIDVSGSMRGAKMEFVRTTLRYLADWIRPDDRISLITFNDEAELICRSVAGRFGALRLHELAEKIEAGGSTHMEAGMRLGYEQVAAYSAPRRRSDRVLLFTDALPNRGSTAPGSFIGLMQHHAERGVGLTTFGVGLSFGPELMRIISETPGGNFVYLDDMSRGGELVTEELDYLVTPLAHDLRLRARAAHGFRVRKIHGVPGTGGVGGWALDVQVPTVFLSKRKGAILVELEATDPEIWHRTRFKVADLELSYRTPEGVLRQRHIGAGYDGGAPPSLTLGHYSYPGVRKLCTLAAEAEMLQEVSRLYHGNHHQEVNWHYFGQRLQRLEERLVADAAALGDEGLRRERQLVAQLRQNLGMRTEPAVEAVPTGEEVWLGR